MRHFTLIALLIFSMALVYGITGSPYCQAADTHTQSDAVSPDQVETMDDALEVKEEDIEPEPQRLYCAEQWTMLYKGQKADIEVTTRGQYNEIAVFSALTAASTSIT